MGLVVCSHDCTNEAESLDCNRMAATGAELLVTNGVSVCGNDECCRHEDENGEDRPCCNMDGVSNMTAEVNYRRKINGKKLYHKLQPIPICEATRVEIRYDIHQDCV